MWGQRGANAYIECVWKDFQKIQSQGVMAKQLCFFTSSTTRDCNAVQGMNCKIKGNKH